jgi:hypothetical protein
MNATDLKCRHLPANTRRRTLLARESRRLDKAVRQQCAANLERARAIMTAFLRPAIRSSIADSALFYAVEDSIVVEAERQFLTAFESALAAVPAGALSRRNRLLHFWLRQADRTGEISRQAGLVWAEMNEVGA